MNEGLTNIIIPQRRIPALEPTLKHMQAGPAPRVPGLGVLDELARVRSTNFDVAAAVCRP